MVKNCGKCEHFVQLDGMFGGCGAGVREEFDHETFSSVPACEAFTPIAQEVECNCPTCSNMAEHMGQIPTNQNGHPMGPMMGMLFNMPPGGMMPMGGMGPCGPQGTSVETEGKTPWVNPLIKNPKPPKPAKVVNLAAWKIEKGKG